MGRFIRDLGEVTIRHRLPERFGSQLDRLKRLRSVAANTGWLMSERMLQMVVSTFVSVWLARYLGPGGFGTLSYAISFVELFGFLTYLGLAGVVTRELVRTPERREELLGTAFLLKLLGGVAAFGAIVGLVFLRVEDTGLRWLVVVIGISTFFDAFTVIDLWYQSQVQSKYAVAARTSAAIIGALLKVVLILLQAPLVLFAWAVTAQSVVQAVTFLLAYRLGAVDVRRWRFSWDEGKRMLRQCWPLILSSAGALLYLKIDQVMLGEMRGAQEVGVYSVAARLSEAWYFLATVVAVSIFPAMVKSQQLPQEVYHRRLQQAYTTMAWGAVAVAVLVTLTADFLITLLYGAAYREAALVLKVHIWTTPAVFMGAILSKWLVVEELLFFSLTRHTLGAVLNVGLNLFLIPLYGAVGAAIATLVAYTTAHYLACYTDSRTRVAGQMMTRALVYPVLALLNKR